MTFDILVITQTISDLEASLDAAFWPHTAVPQRPSLEASRAVIIVCSSSPAERDGFQTVEERAIALAVYLSETVGGYCSDIPTSRSKNARLIEVDLDGVSNRTRSYLLPSTAQ